MAHVAAELRAHALDELEVIGRRIAEVAAPRFRAHALPAVARIACCADHGVTAVADRARDLVAGEGAAALALVRVEHVHGRGAEDGGSDDREKAGVRMPGHEPLLVRCIIVQEFPRRRRLTLLKAGRVRPYLAACRAP